MTSRDDRERRELAAIEAAVATGQANSSDREERELQEIALAVRAEAPLARPDFGRELDARVAEGFPRRRRFRLADRPRRGRLPRLRGWVPRVAVAGAVAAAIALAVTLSLGGNGGERSPQALKAPGATTSVAVRRVERSAELTLSAPGDRLQEVANGAATAAERHGGFVLTSNVTSGAGASGELTLRIPTRQLEATLSDIARLGHLQSRTETGQDMTGPYTQVRSRLGQALIERSTLRDRLRGAHGARRDALRTRLRAVSGQIHSLSSRMQSLRRRTTFATVSVTLQAERAGGGGLTGGGPGAALHDALRTISGAFALVLRALGLLLPLGAVAALAALGMRAARKRRREAALF